MLPQSLLPQQSLGFLPHAGLFLAADPEGGRKYIVLGPHVLGDNHIVKDSHTLPQTDILERTGNAHFRDMVGRWGQNMV